MNVNYYVPIGGEPTLHILPDAYIAPGPDQHMNGARALDFTRGRYGLTDYLRMARQRCVIQAIVKAADPVTLLQKYQELANTTKDIVSTDIPQSALDSFVDLALGSRTPQIRSLVFDASVINPAYPDYNRIRSSSPPRWPTPARRAPARRDSAVVDDAAPAWRRRGDDHRCRPTRRLTDPGGQGHRRPGAGRPRRRTPTRRR